MEAIVAPPSIKRGRSEAKRGPDDLRRLAAKQVQKAMQELETFMETIPNRNWAFKKLMDRGQASLYKAFNESGVQLLKP
jgi:hypothetical protein